MKIAIFTETLLPEINGVAASSSLLFEELQLLGHDVRVVTTSNPLAPPNETGVWRIPSIMLKFAQGRRLGALYSHTVSRMMKEFVPDVIHTQTEFSVGIMGRMAARRLKKPFVHTYHTLYKDYAHYLHMERFDYLAQKIVSAGSRSFCNSATAVIAPSGKTKNVLLGYNVKSPIHVIPTGLRLGKFNPFLYPPEDTARLAASMGIAPGDRVLLYLGRLAKEKNIETIISAMPEIASRDGRIKLLVVGGGTYLDHLKYYARSVGAEGRVIFAGAAPYADIARYYQLGHVFICASSSETQGMTYFEALCSGLPIVVRRDECLDGVLLEGKNGWAFDSDREIVGLVLRVFDDPDMRRLTRENAGYIQKKYYSDVFAQSVADVYAGAIRDYSEKAALEAADK